MLARLDRAFSRDADSGRYVQDLLTAHGDAIVDWVDEGATLLVCGSLLGMAQGVDSALRGLLGDEAVERLQEDGRYLRDVY